MIEDGDRLRKKGNAALIDAIERYEQAKSLNYNNAEAESRIKSISTEGLVKAYQSLESAGKKFASANICDEAQLRFKEAQNLLTYLFYNGMVEQNEFDTASRRIQIAMDNCI